MRSGPELRQLNAEQFTTELDALARIYALAMNAPAAELPGRMAIMERHATYPAFSAVTAVLPGGRDRDQDRGQHRDQDQDRGQHRDLDQDRGQHRDLDQDRGQHRDGGKRPGQAGGQYEDPAGAQYEDPADGQYEDPADGQRALIGFAYGFHGSAGQWWHDLVAASLAARSGSEAAGHWFGDSFEFAEVHVRPDHQARGTGRQMMHALAAGRPERTAVLSTPDGHTRARRLYRSLGFVDLLPAFSFPGAGPPYTIMGAVLPLPDEPPPAARCASPSRR